MATSLCTNWQRCGFGVTFYALKEAVAFLIAITVVIPSDETIWKIIHSLGAEGDDFHGLNKFLVLFEWIGNI